MRYIPWFIRRYYLRKIHKHNISIQDVATIFNTSSDNVEKALEEYEKSLNPFKKVDREVIQIVVSVLSVILVLLTLIEMQAERNAAYLPNISVNGFKLQFIWDENGMITNNPDSLSEKNRLVWDNLCSTSLQGTITTIANLEIQNSGVGVAKDVYVDWLYEDNLAAFQKAFSGCDDVSIEYNNEQIIISINKEPGNMTIGTFYHNGSESLFSFLTNAFDSSETVRIPNQYVVLYELAYAKDLLDRIPMIRFIISCNDIQGEQYRKEFILKPEPELVLVEPNVAGFGSVEFRVVESNNEHISILSRSWYVGIGIIIGLSVAGLALIAWAIGFKPHRKKSCRATKICKQENHSGFKQDSSETAPQAMQNKSKENEMQQ